jgi:hypothetical protein
MNLLYQTTAGVQSSIDYRVASIDSYNPLNPASDVFENALDNVLQRIIGSYNNLTLNLVGRIYQAFPANPLVRDIHDSMYFSSKKNREKRKKEKQQQQQQKRGERMHNPSGESDYAQKQVSSKQKDFWEKHPDKPKPQPKPQRQNYWGWLN